MAPAFAGPPYSPGAGAISSTFLQIPNVFYGPANPGRCRPSLRLPSWIANKVLWAIVPRHPCSLVVCGLYLLDARALIWFAGYIFVIPMPLDASDGLCCFALVPPVTSAGLPWALLCAPGLSFGSPGLSWARGAGLSWDLLSFPRPFYALFQKNGEGSLLQMWRYLLSKNGEGLLLQT